METHTRLGGWTYAGLFTVSLATLMQEILLTRIFSVTMWHHFAFVAISVAMFGLTLGGLRVYLSPEHFPQDRIHASLAHCALLFAISVVLSFLIHANLPFYFAATFSSLLSVAITYFAFTLPFFFSGICICLALTRFPHAVSRLYAADLVGAALGCVLLIGVLRVTDGPTAVVLVAGAAALGAWFFSLAKGEGAARFRPIAFAVCIGLFGFAAFNGYLVRHQAGLIHLGWAKEHRYVPPLYEKWNSYSRITVLGDPNLPQPPFGWGLSARCPPQLQVRQLTARIDEDAATMLTHFHGDLQEVGFLRYDLTNLVHYIRPSARVLVVGSGGGRDILSALVFKQKEVEGVEINGAILDASGKRFGDFTGHLDSLPQVKIINDEARSYLTRQTRPYDIIQFSLVDTWAATAAGALVLSENSLYTLDAWKIFLRRLTPRGVLSVSHWYSQRVPYGIYRMTSLASAALRSLDVQNPRNHLIIVRNMLRQNPGNTPDGLATVLVSRAAFSGEDVDRIEHIAREMQFEIVLDPRFSIDPTFASLAAAKAFPPSRLALPVDLAPPTDNKPYFFYWVRLRDAFRPAMWHSPGTGSNWNAVFIVGSLLLIVTLLTILSILLPLISRHTLKDGTHPWPMLTFFGAIGLGFMLIEISQMQRLMIFLGAPVYGLSVVLFSLLLSSGLGSYFTPQAGPGYPCRPALARLAALLGVLILFGLITPPLLVRFAASTTLVRILVAVSVLFPLGFLMGMPFPLGLKHAAGGSPGLTPWLWGINGATSVYASVLAIVIALAYGISASFWLGFACYVSAVVIFAWETRRKPIASTLPTQEFSLP